MNEALAIQAAIVPRLQAQLRSLAIMIGATPRVAAAPALVDERAAVRAAVEARRSERESGPAASLSPSASGQVGVSAALLAPRSVASEAGAPEPAARLRLANVRSRGGRSTVTPLPARGATPGSMPAPNTSSLRSAEQPRPEPKNVAPIETPRATSAQPAPLPQAQQFADRAEARVTVDAQRASQRLRGSWPAPANTAYSALASRAQVTGADRPAVSAAGTAPLLAPEPRVTLDNSAAAAKRGESRIPAAIGGIPVPFLPGLIEQSDLEELLSDVLARAAIEAGVDLS